MTVIGVFSLAGALIGADVALFPWDDPIRFPVPVTVGLILGFLTGLFIVWVVRQVEETT